ncbi:hypothetical protein Vsou_01450 [Vulcanisaeta souniana JCM 11219]|nr:hypothetical protein Vsou_01450 [Vulcanisaeta souniana JCM 11219]
MNKMHVFLSWFKDGVNPNADAYVVVDVLRFSTTVITALGIGFKRVYATPSLDKALALSRARDIPLAAEVEGIKPPMANLDNSPFEILSIGGTYVGSGRKELVIRSTAGALLTITLAKINVNTYIGSTINASALARKLMEKGYGTINIACAGYKAKEFAIEDLIGAGAIIHEIMKLCNDITLNEEGLAAYYLYKSVSNSLKEVFSQSKSGKIVLSTGHDHDIEIASDVNSSITVPKVTGISEDEIAIIERI